MQFGNFEFDLKIEEKNITIYCSKKLEEFAREFMEYFKSEIIRIEKEFFIENVELNEINVELYDKEEQLLSFYGKAGNNDFSGRFGECGIRAYVNIEGRSGKEYLFKGLIHEIVHYVYKYYVYGGEKERITWADEGMAYFFSKQREELEDEDKYIKFLNNNISNCKVSNLNLLKHDDKSFGISNGPNLSYIAIRNLYETNSHEDFLEIIKNKEKLKEYGRTILNDLIKKYQKEEIQEM